RWSSLTPLPRAPSGTGSNNTGPTGYIQSDLPFIPRMVSRLGLSHHEPVTSNQKRATYPFGSAGGRITLSTHHVPDQTFLGEIRQPDPQPRPRLLLRFPGANQIRQRKKLYCRRRRQRLLPRQCFYRRFGSGRVLLLPEISGTDLQAPLGNAAGRRGR